MQMLTKPFLNLGTYIRRDAKKKFGIWLLLRVIYKERWYYARNQAPPLGEYEKVSQKVRRFATLFSKKYFSCRLSKHTVMSYMGTSPSTVNSKNAIFYKLKVFSTLEFAFIFYWKLSRFRRLRIDEKLVYLSVFSISKISTVFFWNHNYFTWNFSSTNMYYMRDKSLSCIPQKKGTT